jgi:hypothetical protein
MQTSIPASLSWGRGLGKGTGLSHEVTHGNLRMVAGRRLQNMTSTRRLALIAESCRSSVKESQRIYGGSGHLGVVVVAKFSNLSLRSTTADIAEYRQNERQVFPPTDRFY